MSLFQETDAEFLDQSNLIFFSQVVIPWVTIIFQLCRKASNSAF